MSEAKPAPKPEAPKPAPKPAAPKARGGKRMAKVGLVGALIVAVAFLLNHFGLTEFGIGEKGKGEGDKTQKSATPDKTQPDSPVVKVEKTQGDDSAGTLQEANLKLRLGAAGILYHIEPAKGEPISLTQSSFEEAMSNLQSLFEGYDIRQFDVEIGVDYKGMEKDAAMDAVKAALAKIPTAAKISPNQKDIK